MNILVITGGGWSLSANYTMLGWVTRVSTMMGYHLQVGKPFRNVTSH